jgi:hypothetical protein
MIVSKELMTWEENGSGGRMWLLIYPSSLPFSAQLSPLYTDTNTHALKHCSQKCLSHFRVALFGRQGCRTTSVSGEEPAFDFTKN